MGTTALGIPYPASTDSYVPHTDMQDLATEVDTLITADRDRLDDLETRPAWTAYTPVWTSTGTAPAIGNGTITGAYSRQGSVIHVRIAVVFGSTSTYGTGSYRFTLPAGGKVNSLLLMQVKDQSPSLRYSGSVEIVSTGATGDNMRPQVDGTGALTQQGTPITFTTSDSILISGTYEAA